MGYMPAPVEMLNDLTDVSIGSPAEGDMIYRNDSGLYVVVAGTKDTGKVPTIQADGSVSWAAGGGGGGSVPTWVDALDATTGTSLDEFDDDSFSGWTTVTVTGSQTITEALDVCSIQPTAAIGVANTNCILQAHTLSIGDAVEVAIPGMNVDDATQLMVGPVVTNGTTSGAASAWTGLQLWGSSSNTPFLYNCPGTLSANGISTGRGINFFGAVLYMRMEYQAANTFRCWYSSDGVSWMQQPGDISVTMTPSHVGFGWNTSGDGVTNQPVSAAIDYVRIETV